MARLHIDLPEHFAFRTEIPLYTSHIRGGHLDNSQLFLIISEARARLLASFGYSPENTEGLQVAVADVAAQYRSEARWGEVMVVAMTATDFNPRGCDFAWQVTEKTSGREVARGKTGIVFVNPGTRRIGHMPEAFRARWP